MRIKGFIAVFHVCIAILCIAANAAVAAEYGAGSPVSGAVDVVNDGLLTAQETADDAEAYGVWADGIGSGLNTGSIFSEANGVNSAHASGIYISNAAGFLINDGEVMSAAVFETAAPGAHGYSAGIEAYDTSGISNSGVIMSILNAPEDGTEIYPTAFGIYGENSGDISNAGLILSAVKSGFQASSYGICALDSGNIVNQGKVSAAAQGFDWTWGYAHGILAIGSGDIVNDGSLSAVSSTDSVSIAYGIAAIACHRVINAGAIDAYAASDLSWDGTGPIFAYGLYAWESGPVENTGTITATAVGADGFAAGIMAGGASVPATILNSGTIRVAGDDGAGIFINTGDWTVFNPGYVFGTGGTRTLEVYSGSATLADSFRIVFQGNPASTAAPILVSSAGGILNLDGAHLLAQAADDIVWNAPYQVIENYGTVNGAFAGLASANPDIAAFWAGTDNGENAAVAFRYAPQGSAAGSALRLTHLGVLRSKSFVRENTFSELLARHVKKQEVLLSDSGGVASDAVQLTLRPGSDRRDALFIRPYVETFTRPSDGGMGYDADLFGISVAYEKQLAPKAILGGHAGFAQGSVDFTGDGYDSNREDQDLYSLGVHGAWNPDGLHFSGSATLYAATHEYSGLTGGGLNIRDEDDYTSYGAEIEGIGGVVRPFGAWSVMPYAGLGYSWINSPGHTSDADGAAWDTHYGAVNEHILRTILGAQLRTVWTVGRARVIPALGLRWEYALTDNDITVTQSLAGSPSVNAMDEMARSSVVGDASVTFTDGVNSVEMGVMTQLNADLDSGGAWLTMSTSF